MTPTELRANRRELLIRVNDIGVALTHAIEQNGGHGLSGNADVGVLIGLLAGPRASSPVRVAAHLTGGP